MFLMRFLFNIDGQALGQLDNVSPKMSIISSKKCLMFLSTIDFKHYFCLEEK